MRFDKKGKKDSDSIKILHTMENHYLEIWMSYKSSSCLSNPRGAILWRQGEKNRLNVFKNETALHGMAKWYFNGPITCTQMSNSYMHSVSYCILFSFLLIFEYIWKHFLTFLFYLFSFSLESFICRWDSTTVLPDCGCF